jgi:hypothetical protein
MGFPRWPQVLKGGLALLGLALGIADHVRTTLVHVRAKTTAARMVRIMSYLEQDAPESLDPSSFKALLRRHGVERYFDDGWGRPFLVEGWWDRDTRSRHYRVTSWGRAGRRSPCCTRFVVHDWDRNAVMEDGEWRQLWNF